MATLYIFYGSATGNAEGIAKDLAKVELPSHFSSVVCKEMGDFKKYVSEWEKPPAQGRKHGIICISSTTGNGDAPENASRFIRFLKRKQTVESQPFKHCSIAVLGLGDTNYDQFCEMGKYIDKRMVELGAERAKKLACADEATGLEDVVEPWLDSILQDMLRACVVSAPSPDLVPEEKESKEEAEESKEESGLLKVSQSDPHSVENVEVAGSLKISQGDPHLVKDMEVAGSLKVSQSDQQSVENVEVASNSNIAAHPSISGSPLFISDPQSVGNVEVASNSNTAAHPSKSDSPLFIMYGSATGNAEQIAKDLAATYQGLLANPDAHTYFPGVVCCELNQFKKHLPTWGKENVQGTKHGLVIITSTTGNADPPENASRFIRYIKRKQAIDEKPFRHVNFAVLGLGDTNYDQFCATGKEVDRRLALLGGTCVKTLVCADEGTGLEDTVEPWTQSILSDVSDACRGVVPSTVPFQTEALKKQISKAPSKADFEEKKSESVTDEAISERSHHTPGVDSIKAILGVDSSSMIPEVAHSLLPSLGASRSSCELFKDDYEESHDQTTIFADTATISTTSSGAILFTQIRPYESEVVRARYLTKTPDDAAKKIVEVVGIGGVTSGSDLLMARSIFDSAFALDSQDTSLCEKNGKRVVELTLSLPDDYSLEYQPGDTIGLLVPNKADDVAFVLEILLQNHGILPSQKVSIDAGQPITIEKAINEKVDLSCTLKNKKILNSLSQFATNEQEIAALRLLSSKDSAGLKLFQKYIVDQRRSFADILRDFPSCRAISLEGILGLLPAIPPRYYSISSSPLDASKGKRLSIAFSVVDYLTPSLVVLGNEEGRRRIHGIATSYLEATCAHFLAKASDKLQRVPSLRIFPKPTTDFRLPASLSKPIVMIGPGTGIAPFMGFLAHRKALLLSRESHDAASAVVEGTWRGGYEMQMDELSLGEKDSKGLVPAADYRNQQVLGNVDVYFGCRHADHDWLFDQEMKQLLSEGIITNLLTAFSRDSKKSYVQDLMKQPEASQRLVDIMLNQKGVVYVCGDGTSMARDVQITLHEILGKKADGSIDIDAGRAHIDKLKKEGRFLMDIWS